MKFTQWVVEWAIDNGPNVPKVWGPVIANGRTKRPLLHDVKWMAEWDAKWDAKLEEKFRKRRVGGKAVCYRVRKVTFVEIDQ